PAFEMTRAVMALDIIRSRRALGWSQAEQARRAGIRAETLNRIETAKRSPSLSTFDKVHRALEAGEAEQQRKAARRKGKPQSSGDTWRLAVRRHALARLGSWEFWCNLHQIPPLVWICLGRGTCS
ncbi:MAG TPA: helix-turn-helix domain-containing protein, partial [Pirellulales bacterium]|nr:helix-turn-helix domain-containing protein [Pirellulales bacterium]